LQPFHFVQSSLKLTFPSNTHTGYPSPLCNSYYSLQLLPTAMPKFMLHELFCTHSLIIIFIFIKIEKARFLFKIYSFFTCRSQIYCVCYYHNLRFFFNLNMPQTHYCNKIYTTVIIIIHFYTLHTSYISRQAEVCCSDSEEILWEMRPQIQIYNMHHMYIELEIILYLLADCLCQSFKNFRSNLSLGCFQEAALVKKICVYIKRKNLLEIWIHHHHLLSQKSKVSVKSVYLVAHL